MRPPSEASRVARVSIGDSLGSARGATMQFGYQPCVALTAARFGGLQLIGGQA
jgi:hypothetical protein